MSVYHTSDFRKGLKVELEGEPYIMTECNFVKPGKGQALYKCKLKSLIKGSVLDRTFKSDDSLQAADVRESQMQYLYRSGDNFVFMDPDTFDQPELTPEQMGDTAKWLKDGLNCNIVFYNERPISVDAPNHLVLEVVYAEPGARGNTATNVTKTAKVETGAEVQVPIFINQGDKIKVDTRTGEYIERVRE
ncbi:elongation factor P [bacterium]|jgi:elongation factor P|nr:elongation factor P [bacterium]